MHNAGKRNVVGILIDVVDYEGAEEAIIRAALGRKTMSVSALAVHGLMTGALDREHKFRLNQFSLLVPDGQPVRWALNWLHRAPLRERVYGPNLMLRVCARAAREGLPVYFYGSTPEILRSLGQSLQLRFPGLVIAGMESSRFRRLSLIEREQLAERDAEVWPGVAIPALLRTSQTLAEISGFESHVPVSSHLANSRIIEISD